MMTALVSLLAMAAAPAAAPCSPITGAEQLWADRALRWLVVGEGHGTAETPRAFAELLCLAIEARGPVVVALERPDSEQQAIDAFMASDGGAQARAALLAAPAWQSADQDGRQSEAMLGLLETLRQRVAGGSVKRVVAFQPAGGNYADYEREMAGAIQRAGADGALVVALVGNVHAMIKPIGFGGQPPSLRAAGFLPPEQTLTLDAVGNGGSQWACIRLTEPRPGLRDGCAAQDFGPAPDAHPRGIALGADPEKRWSGHFYLGVATTASPPAARR